ncbi:hypothetical protein BJ170DRAFT_684704 [Xylariales sp. AK1849]|nr:hypothetical protein BJ170DRAFT_684704 [Xylariales sp. AK1849]
METDSDLSIFPWPGFIAAFALYLPVLRLLQRTYAGLFPETHAELRQGNSQFSYDMYFTDIIGTVLICINAPACYMAIRTTDRADDQFGVRSPLNASQQICVGTRTLQFMSELYLTETNSKMFYHHILSLLSQATILGGHGPRRQIYIVQLSLVAELISTLKSSLAAHKVHRRRPRLFWWVATMHVSSWGIRLAFNIYALSEVLFYSGGSPMERTLNSLGHVIILGFGFHVVWYNGNRNGLWDIVLDRPAYFLFLGRHKLTVFHVALKASMVLGMLSTLLLHVVGYAVDSAAPELTYGPLCILLTCISGLLPLNVTSQPRYYVHGGIILATLVALGSSAALQGIAATPSLASPAISLLLQDAIIMAGRYFDGDTPSPADQANGATRHRKSEKAARLYLSKSFASLVNYVTIGFLLVHGRLTLSEAGAVAMTTREAFELFSAVVEAKLVGRQNSCGLFGRWISLCRNLMASFVLAYLYTARSLETLVLADVTLERPMVYTTPAVTSIFFSSILILMSGSAHCRKVASCMCHTKRLAILIAAVIGFTAVAVMFAYPKVYFKGYVPGHTETASEARAPMTRTITTATHVLWHLASSPAPMAAMIGALLAPTNWTTLW